MPPYVAHVGNIQNRLESDLALDTKAVAIYAGYFAGPGDGGERGWEQDTGATAVGAHIPVIQEGSGLGRRISIEGSRTRAIVVKNAASSADGGLSIAERIVRNSEPGPIL